MRVTSEVWVRSYLRRCAAVGITGAVARHGDDRAGAIFVKVSRLDGSAQLFVPAPSGFASSGAGWKFIAHAGNEVGSEAEIDAYLGRQMQFDTDLWVVEIEDRQGRHLLDGEIMPPDVAGSG
jgi:hypothetical protein